MVKQTQRAQSYDKTTLINGSRRLNGPYNLRNLEKSSDEVQKWDF